MLLRPICHIILFASVAFVDKCNKIVLRNYIVTWNMSVCVERFVGTVLFIKDLYCNILVIKIGVC